MGQRSDQIDLNNDYLPENADVPQDGVLPNNVNTMQDVERQAQRDTDAKDAKDEDPDQIRGDIQQTRSEMSSTIDAIQDKLNPHNLMEQAKDTVREATVGKVQDMVSDVGYKAQSAGNTMWDTIRENPVPTALAAFGLGWLIWKGRSNAQSNQHMSGNYNYQNQRFNEQRYTPQYQGYQTQGYYQNRGYTPGYQGQADYTMRGGYTTSGSQNQGQSAMSNVQDKASDMASQAKDKVQDVAGNVQDKMGDIADTMQDRAGDFADNMQWRAQQSNDWFQNQLDQNPLAVAGVALALGAVVGLAVPETQRENQLMGPAHDKLMDKAQDVVQQTTPKVQAVAHEAVNAAKQEAKDQGLTSSSSTSSTTSASTQ